jgi:hypothetical protein
MAGENSGELDIYVEDPFAKCLLEAAFTPEIRSRVVVIPIGSPDTICQQLAARYRENPKGDAIAVVDGDAAARIPALEATFSSWFADKQKSTDWLKGRLLALPGTKGPEAYVVARLVRASADERRALLPEDDPEVVEMAIARVSAFDPHDALVELAKALNISSDALALLCCRFVAQVDRAKFGDIIGQINEQLSAV